MNLKTQIARYLKEQQGSYDIEQVDKIISVFTNWYKDMNDYPELMDILNEEEEQNIDL